MLGIKGMLLALLGVGACGGATASAPSDQDGDHVPDPRDGCPLIPEDRDGDLDEDGCPEGSPRRDRDGDGVVDDRDVCPDVPEDRDGDRDEDGCPERSRGTAVAPTAPVCTAPSDCAATERCLSPEESRWNYCGAPRPPACGVGEIGDSCGNCFTSCQADHECTEGMTCNGSYCVSQRQCAAPRPPRP